MAKLPTAKEMERLSLLAAEEEWLRPYVHISDFAAVKPHLAPSFERMVAIIKAQDARIAMLERELKEQAQ